MTESNAETVPRRWWQLTWVEVLVVVAIIAVLLALLIPPARWIADGTPVLPVRVFVFDPDSGQPIAGASVLLSRGLRMTRVEDGPEIAKQFKGVRTWKESVKPDQQAITNDAGFVTINFEFSSTATEVNPNPKSSPSKCWIMIQAAGYGTAIVTPGLPAVEVQNVRELGGFLVPVGLSQVE